MPSYLVGPGNANDGAGGAQTIANAARSVDLNIPEYTELQVEISTPASFDRNVTFQITFDDPTVAAASANWLSAQYADTSVAGGILTGSFAPGASARKVYAILTHGRRFSINVSGGTVGSLTWRCVANSTGAGNMGLSAAPGTGATTSLSAASTGTGTAVDFGGARSTIAMQVTEAVGSTAGIVALEGSIDGTNYMVLDTYDLSVDATGDIIVSSGVPVIKARARITSNITGGGAPAITATITGV